ncbi:DUF3100 domain-containing protein [Scopulibacillus cellulosilyticus]|uniref:DUF3100 domain-containing protein n=1 Tax=Scopulibacillus cellulosilyticus TaxID=2665665 RepID=A0ABW2Q7J0_9BACL
MTNKMARAKNVKLHIFVFILVVISEFIGTRKFNIGIGVIALFPMLYAMVLGAFISWPSFKWLSNGEMKKAANFLGISVMLFVVKMGTMVGPSLSQVFHSGVSFISQEIGHILGTIVLGLPIAILIGMKREAIGATFSIDREGNLAVIAEKYGADSPEGRGALGVYICGTLFGSIYISFLASILASLKVFDPLSLAMAAGIGSGSMMAAGTGALAVIYPHMAKQIALFAASANMIGSAVGTYLCIFFSLPVTARLYKWLQPILGRKKIKEASPVIRESEDANI